MNIFAGNVTLNGSKNIGDDFDFDFLESISLSGDKNLYIFGETKMNSSEDIINYLEQYFGELKNYDISISTEDKIEVIPYDFDEGIYEVVSFEGEHVTFEEINDRFAEHDAIFSVREAEYSEKFGNKIIRADFVY